MIAAASSQVTAAFLELGLASLVLAAFAWLAGRLRISAIPLYLLAGLAASFEGPLSIEGSSDFVDVAAEIGVLLLLFTLGLEYTPRELNTALRRGALGGVLDLVANAAPGMIVGLLLGWGPVSALLLAGVTYISSSGVVSKLLDDLKRLGNRETPSVLTSLVLEDLVMAVYLPVVAVLLAGTSPARGALDIGVALAVVVTILVVLGRFGQPVADLMERRSGAVEDEVALLSVFGAVLLASGLVQQVDVSAAVGAFLVGVAISGPAQHRAARLIGPLRDLFAAIFFFAFAARIELSELPAVAPLALALAVVGAGTKLFTGWVVAARDGVGTNGRWRAGTALVARGEFSIVIAGLGTAAGGRPELGALSAAYVLVLAVVGPVLARSEVAPSWVHRLAGRSPERA